MAYDQFSAERSVSETLRILLAPPRDHAEAKLADHRTLGTLLMAVAGIVGTSLWIWDYVLDPAGARETIGLRLLMIPLCLTGALAYRYGRDYRWVFALNAIATLLAEVVYLMILNRLESGMTYGHAGFMYFFMVGLLVLQGFSLGLNLVYVVLAAALPQVLAWGGIAPNFQHAHYAVLIWPGAAMTAAALAAFSYGYLARYETRQVLKRASLTDPLTGAHNRRGFLASLAEEMERSRRGGHRLALVMLDIDHFKPINDRYGHPAGDAVIREVAKRCMAAARRIDTVARWGGEEFTLLLPDTTLHGALSCAERIRTDIAERQFRGPEGEAIALTVSVGVAELHSEDRTDDDFIGRADAALYSAKAAGRNRSHTANGRGELCAEGSTAVAPHVRPAVALQSRD